jgi:hypothetical protein
MEYIELALQIVGGASLIVAGLGKIAGITSTTKDDAIVGKISKYLSYAVTVLEKLALNPKK